MFSGYLAHKIRNVCNCFYSRISLTFLILMFQASQRLENENNGLDNLGKQFFSKRLVVVIILIVRYFVFKHHTCSVLFKIKKTL